MDPQSMLIGYVIGGAVQTIICVVVVRLRLKQDR